MIVAIRLLFFLFLFNKGVFAQEDSINKKRFYITTGIQSVGVPASFLLLNQTWYDDFQKTPFHSFNDNDEWLQMDKAGHFVTAAYLTRVNSSLYRWTGLNKKKASLFGAGFSFLYLTTIEVLDGYSSGWGFSYGDMAVNLGGCLAQGFQSATGKQILSFKYSFRSTPFPLERPELLGTSLAERMLKDYNGQIYWMCFSPWSLLKKNWAPYIALAVGYSGHGMTGGSVNPQFNEQGLRLNDYKRYRQYYLSLDIDLSKIQTDVKWFKIIAETFSFVRIPFPALEFSQGKVRVGVW